MSFSEDVMLKSYLGESESPPCVSDNYIFSTNQSSLHTIITDIIQQSHFRMYSNNKSTSKSKLCICACTYTMDNYQLSAVFILFFKDLITALALMQPQELK